MAAQSITEFTDRMFYENIPSIEIVDQNFLLGCSIYACEHQRMLLVEELDMTQLHEIDKISSSNPKEHLEGILALLGGWPPTNSYAPLCAKNQEYPCVVLGSLVNAILFDGKYFRSRQEFSQPLFSQILANDKVRICIKSEDEPGKPAFYSNKGITSVYEMILYSFTFNHPFRNE